MVSGAYLANKLKELISKDAVVKDAELQAAFREYSRVRGQLVKQTMQASHAMQRMESFDTPVLKFIQQKLVSKMPVDGILARFPPAFTTASSLKYIPLPSNPGTFPFDDEIKMKLGDRAMRWNIFWISLLAINVWIHRTCFQYVGETQPQASHLSNPFLVSKFGEVFSWVFDEDQSWNDKFYYHSLIAATMSTICIESYRQSFLLKAVSR